MPSFLSKPELTIANTTKNQSQDVACVFTTGSHLSHSLQRSHDEELLGRGIVFHAQHVGFAADLAVFNIVLTPANRLIHGSRIPLATARTLKTSFHADVPDNTLAL